MGKKKKEKGITLIALIITIIILLILAGISINLISGENGIIARAKQAKQESMKAETLESLNILLDEWEMENIINSKSLYDFLNEKAQDSSNKITKVTLNDDGTITVTIKGYTYTLNSKGKIEQENEVIPDEDKDTIDLLGTLYVQHDEDNNDVYELVKNTESDTTTLYINLYVEYTASKRWKVQWDGTAQKNIAEFENDTTAKYGSLSLDNAVHVQEGEQYFIKLVAPDTNHPGVMFFDENDEYIDKSITSYWEAGSGAVVTVPTGATKMAVTRYNNQKYSLQKIVNVTSQEFDEIAKIQDKNKIMASVEARYQKYLEDPIVYKDFGKAYISFVNDDTTPNIDQYVDLFISKNIPLCLATVPENIIENASNGTESRLDVCRRVVNAGGEILAHDGDVVTESNYMDYNFMFNKYISRKKLFESYKLDVNSIILAGGLGYIYNETTAKWAASYYKSSDLYGVEIDGVNNSVYKYGRDCLSNYSTIDALKTKVDEIISNKKWYIFYFHNYNEISEENLSALLDYINTKSSDELEVVTYKTIYDNFAVKQSEL